MGQGLEAKDGTWKDLQDFDPEFSAQGQREVDRNINYDCAIMHFKHFQAAPLDMPRFLWRAQGTEYGIRTQSKNYTLITRRRRRKLKQLCLDVEYV